MAKIKHNNFIDTVNSVISGAKNEGVLHLYAEDSFLNGRTLQIEGKQMYHFGTTGYLGLEQDERIKQAAINAIQKFGTQFPLSKTYISNPLYAELEAKIEKMYGITPVITKNSTLGHLAVIPTVVRDEDAVILDHQVHWSVQNACQQLKLRGIPVEMVRHNNLSMVEDKIKELANRGGKIWYMADGVYSMFGDFAPIPELIKLTQKYPQLHLYFDDVHGMSWKGKNGTGYVFDSFNQLPNNVLIVSTLSKTFGASGAMLICSDGKLRDKIKNFGGPLTFSAQLEPASLAAASSSADIHLSPEITVMQNELTERISYFNSLLEDSPVPLIVKNDSPVFFIGTGMPATAYNLTQKLFKEGFFVNPGLYPAVPVKNTGIRITISRHNQKEDIKALAEALQFHLPKALEETDNSLDKIQRSFRLERIFKKVKKVSVDSGLLKFQFETSIHNIDKDFWNTSLGGQSVFDWEGMCYLEETFKNNPNPQDNWDFYYCIIRDTANMPILVTFFTCSLWKDDMLLPESVSKQLEEKRKSNPLYHTSKVVSMGSLFTEGQHYYCNNQHPLQNEAIKMLLSKADELYHDVNADMLVFRDFETDNNWDDVLHNQGFVKVVMPEACTVTDNTWSTIEDFTKKLSPRSRKHFNKEVLPFETCFDIQVKSNLSDLELEKAYQLYTNVKDNNVAINTFTYPLSAFKKMSDYASWEFIVLYLKENESKEPEMVGVVFGYKNLKRAYVPTLIGMNYNYVQELHLYRQLLFQIIKRANTLGISKIDFGFSATFEKRKLGAEIIPKIAYIQAKDNYSFEALNSLQNDIK
ncbi:2-amino-3-ketobutyrate coenzyme A ligase [Flavobacterium cauense R2A-7]|uniref:7-keto-8-aminopelargonate synthetase-like enzyme n=1 Tax=Flavobacterium cauense R2A-7 TaxID=1341154 RepID=V6RYJ4_9FLAO|nr:aminotransferase class I/II-fold pyridoxal phosphate-dependent enzyme [Flavobacterium cauense]ESU19097.1 2-amino-3-ketobutyrate coenzyme A ligase [Flavobacterium cauense R2A-7]KGO82273.1 aminotransferase class I/II [Flavobacterium cauense R2A-7]TWI15233.1 7-keto-8-aminopelargonate synthetase-like enzyme [Flavobacterium cauense R2A-7]